MSVNKSEPPEQDTTTATKARTPARITAAERRRRKEAEAARLRAEGLDYDAIADRLGYRDRSGAHKAARRALADVVRHSTDEARLLAMQRLDALRVRLVGIATDDGVATRDQVSALRVLLNVEQREAALLGLDITAAPVVTGDILDAEIRRLNNEIGKLDALPVRDPWEDWTPPGQHLDDNDGHPGAEVVPFRTNGHTNGQGTNGRGRGD